MSHHTDQEVIAIKEWMSKEPHLPLIHDDLIIIRFLKICGSLEDTKTCIDRFCVNRSKMPEVFSSRDPLLPNIKLLLSTAVVSVYEYEDNEIIIYKYDNPNNESYVFYDFLKSISFHCDYWIKFEPFVAEGQIVILDTSYYSLKMIFKTNILYLRSFIMFLLESMPVRVKKIIIVNAPFFYDKMYALIRPLLPSAICDIIHFFRDYQSLHDIIDKKYLPEEYGGDAPSMYIQYEKRLKKIKEEREMFRDDNLWKATDKKKSKNNVNVPSNNS